MISVRPPRRPAAWSRAAGFALTALLAVLPLAALAAEEPVAGRDYTEIADPARYSPEDGKIEVVEVFGYTCPHCARFEPALAQWAARLPDDVTLVRVPAPFGGYWIPYAQAFHAADAQGLVQRTHRAVFRAIHDERALPVSNATAAELAAFYAGHGADTERFIADMQSEQTAAELARARGFLTRSGVTGTPSLVVNGRYLVTGRSAADNLRITDALIQRERERTGAAR